MYFLEPLVGNGCSLVHSLKQVLMSLRLAWPQRTHLALSDIRTTQTRSVAVLMHLSSWVLSQSRAKPIQIPSDLQRAPLTLSLLTELLVSTTNTLWLAHFPSSVMTYITFRSFGLGAF